MISETGNRLRVCAELRQGFPNLRVSAREIQPGRRLLASSKPNGLQCSAWYPLCHERALLSSAFASVELGFPQGAATSQNRTRCACYKYVV